MSNEPVLEDLFTRPPAERVDAARNRVRVLEAADRLFAERGACNVSMDEVAAAAGVGKGTLYRRFNDQAGLALALLEEKESKLQEAVIRGRPPVGPGVPAAERLQAFLNALIDLLDAHSELHVLSETSSRGARYRSGLYAFYRLHVELLLREILPGGMSWFWQTSCWLPWRPISSSICETSEASTLAGSELASWTLLMRSLSRPERATPEKARLVTRLRLRRLLGRPLRTAPPCRCPLRSQDQSGSACLGL